MKALCQLGYTGRGHTSWQNHGVFSRTGKATTKGVTGISGYTRISKVQYVTGAGQSLYQEQKDDVTMSVKVWNVYIGAMSGMGSGPTEGVDIRSWSCESGDGNDASVNDYDVEGCDQHWSEAKKNPDVSNRGSGHNSQWLSTNIYGPTNGGFKLFSMVQLMWAHIS